MISRTAPPSTPPRRVALFLCAAFAVLAISAVAVFVGLEIQAEVRHSAEGTIDRPSYNLVQTGQTRAQVVDLLGSEPRGAEAVPLGITQPDCVIYDRRSGRSGHYRFCFQNGVVVSKSRSAWPT